MHLQFIYILISDVALLWRYYMVIGECNLPNIAVQFVNNPICVPKKDNHIN